MNLSRRKEIWERVESRVFNEFRSFVGDRLIGDRLAGLIHGIIMRSSSGRTETIVTFTIKKIKLNLKL